MHAVQRWLLRWAERIAVGSVVAVVLALAMCEARAQERVDALIVTGLDVSSSINALETILQIKGMAQAIQSPAVLSAIQAGPHGSIGFAVFVWADGDYPALSEWRQIGSAEQAAAVAAEMLARLDAIVAGQAGKIGSLTDLSGAMEHADLLLSQAPFRGARQMVNIIGNGADNVGDAPLAIRDALVARGVTVNGVVVGGDQKVVTYFRQNVIGGKRAFVLAANDVDQIAYTFALKFTSEIASAE